ncbi:TonB family protein [Bradyrhizobium ontarionense]|uniref:TonB family protein n=1 Tax=Bradyrhizobium ontarionense TaxID=2898149 RepID=A0ABY3R6Q4_9BRAD|nr:TonB family protein [Bradyrhizobium sp. A19]UFZ02697.1 TonB family protein [Bradyrhizobium sp. A19]
MAATIVSTAHILAFVGYLAFYRPTADLAAAPVVTVELLPPPTEPPSQTVGQAPTQNAPVPQPAEELAPPPAPSPEDRPPEPEQQSAAAEPPPSSAPAEQTPQPTAPSETAEPLVEAQAPVEKVVEQPKSETKIGPPPARRPKVEHADRKKPAAKSAETAPAQAPKLIAPPRHQADASVGADDGRSAWLGELRARVLREKRYPAAVERQNVTVQLNFTVTRNGRVLSRHITRSSGSPAYDQEALAMIERAQPLPPFPPSMPQAQTVLTIPITFTH